jgi:hypothetical protein
MGIHRSLQNIIVPFAKVLPLVRVFLGQVRAAFNISEEKGDGSIRLISHKCPPEVPEFSLFKQPVQSHMRFWRFALEPGSAIERLWGIANLIQRQLCLAVS